MIPIKTAAEIAIIKEGGRILAVIMEELEKMVAPGITTRELDKVAEDLIFKFGGKPSFKGYDGFPASLCVSINEEIVHCVPSQRILKEGDIVSLDSGIFLKGFHSDMARTLPVGKVSPLAKKLIAVTKKALALAIKEVRPGAHFGGPGQVIQKYVESQGFSVIRELCGHGIGQELHQEPQILNYGKKGSGPEIKKGMVFCLEPMVTGGDWKIKKSKDGFGFITLDGSLSCHFEHTVAVTAAGCQVLTSLS